MEKETVLIYTMGKVGSSSIYQSLNSSDKFKPYHIHSLNKKVLLNLKQSLIKNQLKIEKHITESELILNSLSDSDKEVKIITLVRDPISRNIAAYFQNLDYFNSSKPGIENNFKITSKEVENCIKMKIPNFITEILSSMSPATFPTSQSLLTSLSNRGISDEYIKKYKSRLLKATNKYFRKVNNLILDFQKNYYHGVPLNWFDREYKTVLNIDIYVSNFPRLKGYQIIRKGKFSCLLLKLEIPDKKKERIIKEFLSTNNFKINNTNFGNDKFYGLAYKAFKSDIKLSEDYIKKMLNSQYSKHFYNKDQRKDIKTKWSSPL